MTEKQAGVLIPFPPQCILEPLDKSLGPYKFRARFLASDFISLLVMPALFLMHHTERASQWATRMVGHNPALGTDN